MHLSYELFECNALWYEPTLMLATSSFSCIVSQSGSEWWDDGLNTTFTHVADCGEKCVE